MPAIGSCLSASLLLRSLIRKTNFLPNSDYSKGICLMLTGTSVLLQTQNSLMIQAAAQTAQKEDQMRNSKAEQFLQRRLQAQTRKLFSSWTLLAAERLIRHNQAYLTLSKLAKSQEVGAILHPAMNVAYIPRILHVLPGGNFMVLLGTKCYTSFHCKLQTLLVTENSP